MILPSSIVTDSTLTTPPRKHKYAPYFCSGVLDVENEYGRTELIIYVVIEFFIFIPAIIIMALVNMVYLLKLSETQDVSDLQETQVISVFISSLIFCSVIVSLYLLAQQVFDTSFSGRGGGGGGGKSHFQREAEYSYRCYLLIIFNVLLFYFLFSVVYFNTPQLSSNISAFFFIVIMVLFLSGQFIIIDKINVLVKLNEYSEFHNYPLFFLILTLIGLIGFFILPLKFLKN